MASIRNSSVKKLLSEFKKISENNPELYDKFIKEYNRPLKEGLYSDYANRDALLELVRYHSSSRDGYVSLKSYKEHMPAGQKSIYYLTGGKEETLKSSPLLEAYKKKGYEVLIMDDDIDEIVISNVYEYEKLPLKAINKAAAMDDLKEEGDEKEKEEKKDLVEKIKKALADKVKDVRISSRLVDTPAVVVNDDNDPSAQMQRIMKQMGGPEMGDVKPILEVNASSPLIRKIEQSSDEEYVKTLSSIVLSSAMLQEGIMPSDPVAYTKAISELLSK